MYKDDSRLCPESRAFGACLSLNAEHPLHQAAIEMLQLAVAERNGRLNEAAADLKVPYRTFHRWVSKFPEIRLSKDDQQ